MVQFCPASAFLLRLLLSLALTVSASADDVSYTKPPKCLIWLQGEECTDHNWIEGPTDQCWHMGWPSTQGGVLDLAAWRLPAEGHYFAKFPFEVPKTDSYVLYFLGRVPGTLASGIEWSLDGEPRGTCYGATWEAPGLVTQTRWWKYGVIRLGEFEAAEGWHTITITVREVVRDFIHSLYNQQIDALGIAPASWPVEAADPPRPQQPVVPEPVNAAAAADPADAEAVVVEAEGISLHLSRHNGGLRELALTGDDPVTLVHSRQASALVTVAFRDGREAILAGDAQVIRESGGTVLTLRNELVAGELRFAPDATNELRLTARITNHSDTPIWRVSFDLSSGIGLGGDAADDTWIVAQDALAPDALVGRHRRISPHTFSFDWVCVNDDTATLYAMFEDRGLLDTEVIFGRDDSAKATGALRFSKFPRIRPGETWAAPPLIIGAYRGGDWHAAGDRFSRWWYGWAKSPRIPDWVQRMGAMTLGYSVHEEDAIDRNRERVQQLRDATGVAAFHGPSWFSGNTECWYPVQWHLDPDGLRRFRHVTDDLRATGGRSSIYSNPLMFSRASPEYELWGRDLTTVTADGKIQLTEHHTHHHPMALPYPNETLARRFCAIMETPVVLGRPDMLYMDQLGAVPAHLDFAPDRHGHVHYGEWTAGSAEFVRTVQECLVSQRPNLATCVECPCPALQQYVSFSMYGTTEVLRYVFPTYYGLVGPYGAVPGDQAVALARSALLTGQPLLLVDAAMDKAEPDQREAVRDIITLKQALDPRLYAARYRQTVGLGVPEGVQASVFVAEDSLLIPFVNPEGEAEKALTIDPKILGATLAGEARVFSFGAHDAPKACAVRQGGDGLTMSLDGLPGGILEIR